MERDLPKLLQREPRAPRRGRRCCAIKAAVVGQTKPRAASVRSSLRNTIGNGLEAISRYGRYLNGEAISIGQVATAKLSAELLSLPAAEVGRIKEIFHRAGLPTDVKLSARQLECLFAAMRLDKKVSGGEIKFVLASRIGEVRWGQRVPPPLVERALAGYAIANRKSQI